MGLLEGRSVSPPTPWRAEDTASLLPVQQTVTGHQMGANTGHPGWSQQLGGKGGGFQIVDPSHFCLQYADSALTFHCIYVWFFGRVEPSSSRL